MSLVLALLLSTAQAADQAPAFAAQKAEWTQRRELDAAVRRHVPARGLLFLSGGFVSRARRLSLSLPDGTLSYAQGAVNASAAGKLEKQGKLKLEPQQLARAVRLANNIAASKKSFMNLPPIGDFDVRLVLADKHQVKDLDAHGPAIGPVEELYTYLWSLVPPDPDRK